MILLFNVYLTPDVSSYNLTYQRGLLPSFDKFDILKYTISSLAVIPWDQAIINIELGSVYKIFESNIKEYVEQEFKNINFQYSNKRAKTIKEWQKIAYDLLEYKDEILWYCGNHDHVFLGKDLSTVNKIENLLKSNDKPFSLVVHSHRSVCRQMFYEQHKDFIITKFTHFNAMSSVKCIYFWEFWNSFDSSDAYIPRSDWTQVSEQNIDWISYSFHDLLFEHFDGSHFGYESKPALNNDQPLIIPNNFFNKNIKIKLGSPEKDYYTLNPLAPLHKIVDPYGVDSFWTLEDIPLFWKSRITDVKIDSDIDLEKIKNHSIMKKIKELHPYEFTSSKLTKRQVDIINSYKNVFGIEDNFIEEFKKKL